MAKVFFCHSCRLHHDQLAAGNFKVNRKRTKHTFSAKHIMPNAPATRIEKWSRDKVETSDNTEENNHAYANVSKEQKDPGTKTYFNKLNNNVKMLETRNKTLRACDQRFIDSN